MSRASSGVRPATGTSRSSSRRFAKANCFSLAAFGW
jgi:hypothetical protein